MRGSTSAATIARVGSRGDSSTDGVTNNKEDFEQQQAAARRQIEPQQEEYDDIHHPLSCIDNTCDALISIFGAGSDKQDQEVEQTFRSVSSCYQEHRAEEPIHERQEVIERQSIQSQVVVPPVAAAASNRALSKKNRKKDKKSNKKRKSRAAPKGVTVDDHQVEARRKSGFSRWWKKRHKASGGNRSKSAPKSRSTKESDSGNIGKTRAPASPAIAVAPPEYVDMSDVYNEPPPKFATSFNSAARDLPPAEVSDSDSYSEEEESVNVWRELNDMWEESRHNLVRVISENISVNEAQASDVEEDELMDHYERAVAAEQLLESANTGRKRSPEELTV